MNTKKTFLAVGMIVLGVSIASILFTLTFVGSGWVNIVYAFFGLVPIMYGTVILVRLKAKKEADKKEDIEPGEVVADSESTESAVDAEAVEDPKDPLINFVESGKAFIIAGTYCDFKAEKIFNIISIMKYVDDGYDKMFVGWYYMGIGPVCADDISRLGGDKADTDKLKFPDHGRLAVAEPISDSLIYETTIEEVVKVMGLAKERIEERKNKIVNKMLTDLEF